MSLFYPVSFKPVAPGIEFIPILGYDYRMKKHSAKREKKYASSKKCMG